MNALNYLDYVLFNHYVILFNGTQGIARSNNVRIHIVTSHTQWRCSLLNLIEIRKNIIYSTKMFVQIGKYSHFNKFDKTVGHC